MKQSWKIVVMGLAIAGLFSTTETRAVAQNITLDGTLGSTGTLTGPRYNIPQQAGRKVGNNLFHSFGQFNLNANEVANFQGTGVTNILVRVTGGQSTLNGQIQAPANFFLINPAGIIFGRDARLAVRGSFVASTASSLKFADGTEFSATAPQTPPLLTISTPIGLQFEQNPGAIRNQSQTTNSQGTKVGLAVQPGRTLAIVGGEVNLEGGYLTAPEGQINLGSVAEGLVSLNSVPKGWTLEYDNVKNFQDIKLSQQAIVDASGIRSGDIQVQGRNIRITEGSRIQTMPLGSRPGGTLAVTASELVELVGTSVDRTTPSSLRTRTERNGDAGALTITAKQLKIRDGAVISTGSFGSTGTRSTPPNTGAGGDLTINATDSVELTGETIRETFAETFQSRLTTQTRTSGSAGDLTISTGKLILQDGAQISTGTFPSSEGKGGDLTVIADTIEVIGASADDRRIDGPEVSRITSQTTGNGKAGTLTLTARRLSVRDGGLISVAAVSRSSDLDNLSRGEGGTLKITTSEAVEVIGGLAKGTSLSRERNRSRLTSGTESAEKAGDLTINTPQLIIQDGAQVTSGALFYSKGQGGNLTVNASEVKVIGESLYGEQVYSRLTARTSGQGNAGNLTINTEKLLIQDGGQVSADTLSLALGTGGKLDVNASNSVAVSGAAKDSFPSRLSATTNNVRSAGNLTIDTPTLIVRDGAQITVSSTKAGNAGNLVIKSRVLRLDNHGILQATTESGEGGNIEVRSQDLLLMRRGSEISTTAGSQGAGGNGGNIAIDTRFLVGAPGENSDITANAFTGKGGQVTINAQIFGLVLRSREELQRILPSTLDPRLLSTNDITAISQANPNLNGQVTINAPDIDPNRGLVTLPTAFVTPQVTQSCRSRVSRASSEFIVTGRGGVPPNPGEALSSDAVQVGLVTLNPGSDKPANSHAVQPSSPTTITEAQGWIVDRAGNVTLVAEAPTISSSYPQGVALQSPSASMPLCERSLRDTRKGSQPNGG
jgi:filamentous hemagglutinin family protein